MFEITRLKESIKKGNLKLYLEKLCIIGFDFLFNPPYYKDALAYGLLGGGNRASNYKT